ncbi:MAG TPA: hypothetical protein VG269_27220 [Tepidisphaeraceae bacterium]|jgi:hypothetical protein|nr:hypothetical protein [Tepidisphaeraceae bacterium]
MESTANNEPKSRVSRSRQPPGFRFSRTDGAVILGGALMTWLAWGFLGTFALVFVIVLAHFFLFCNVVRMRRPYELFWAAVFVINTLLWSLSGDLNWWRVLAVQIPVTLVLIAMEIASDRYHGVGYKWKRLPAAENRIK